MHEILNDLGTNTIYGFSETWLKADDDDDDVIDIYHRRIEEAE